MKKRLMAVLLCVCMAAVLLTPYAGVLTADGALLLGVAGADGSLTEGGDDAVLTEGGESGKATDPAPTTVQSAPQEEQPAPQQGQSEPQAEGAPQTEGEAKQPEETKAEQPAQTEKVSEPEGEAKQPEETKAEQSAQTEKPALPKYVWDSENDVVWKDGSEKLALKDYVVRANWTALAYKGPTDSSAKTYATGARVRVCDEIRYEDRDGIERKWSVVLDGSDFYFVLSEALESAPELPAQAPAQTDMKSLFGIGDNVDPARIINPDQPVATYNFYNGTALVQSENVKNGESLKEPEPPEPPTTDEGQTFEGWYTAAEGGEQFTSFGTALTVTETTTISLYARFKTVYYTVYFKTEDGNLVLDTRQGTKDTVIDNFGSVNVSNYNLAANQSVIGWKDENNHEVTFVTITDKDITLTAVIGKGYWITFDSKDGSYVAPAFYLSGTEATAPTNPTKPGYEFAGWYTDESLSHVADFAQIKESTILYAGWTEQTDVKYTVIYKVENADDNEYSYLKSDEKTGKTGAQTAAEALNSFPSDFKEDKSGFTVQPITQQTIKGDGSTIVNVYYKRDVYTVEFYKNNGSPTKPDWVEYSEHRITAKYGANIRKQWPTVSNSTTWSTTKEYEKEGLFFPTYYLKGPYQVNIETMPLNGDKFYGPLTGSGVQTAYYYTEVLPGETGTTYNGVVYEEHHKDQSPGSTSVITNEDKYPITGFTYKEFVANSSSSGGYYYNNAKFYYTRNTYKVVYMNNGVKEYEKPYKYEADISGAGGYTAATPPAGTTGYVFVGWYEDPAGQTVYNFTDKTMPANNITVYAKWVAPTFTVTVYDADKTKVLKTFSDIPRGGSISADQMPKDDVTVPQGSEFLGWVNKADDKPFNFDTKIYQKYELYALVGSKDGYTVTYDKNGGTGDVPSDTNKYAAGTQATVLDKGGLIPPADKEFFLGWATTADATTAKYQPGDTMIINANITLYAVWGDKPATTTLTYNANYPNATPPEKTHALEDGTTNLPNNTKVKLYDKDTFTRDGYELIGWAKNANATEADYDFGAEVIVDIDITAGANILYAVWEQLTTTVTVTKRVEGPMGDKTQAFEFEYSLDNGETWRNLNEAGLKHNESAQITGVTINSTLFIREKKVTNYTVTAGSSVQQKDISVTDGTNGYFSVTVPNVAADETITVTNTNTLVPDTGVILDSLPYVLILAVVALGAAGVVIRRRRSREDD